ncbi:hypothetical protein CAEBREN_13708 [Caenorhabditis brenneri]|uniref:F-box domain-containing protein n=1 Tax=Caenorhabditis brenneri TaxID=135651 RepID=G0N1G8_CAEBE|nr:hypothetical protein CAEBREN_13708 [Caenorhabditis brenneri]
MESKDLNLLQMPEVIMGHILDKLELPDILILRKTCHHLRTLVDDLHPEPKIFGTSIEVDPRWIEIKIDLGKNSQTYPCGKHLRIIYSVTKKPDNGREICKVQWIRTDRSRVVCFDDVDFIKLFCSDFETIYGGKTFEFSKKPKNPSRVQDYFYWDLLYPPPGIQQLISSLESTLKNRPRPLPVKEFCANGYEKSHVLQIMPLFEPKTLEKISIWKMSSRDLDGFSELKQWKMAKVLWFDFVHMGATLQEFKDFEKIKIKQLEEIKVNDVLAMKEAILNSTSNLTTGRIEFGACDGEQNFLQTYGFPFTDIDQVGDERKSWFFKIPNKKSVLRISFCFMYLEFAVQEDPPTNALVH